MWTDQNGAAVYEPFDADRIAARDEEIQWLKAHHRRDWKLINGELIRSGAPTALEGSYGGLTAYPPAQSGAAVTGGTANVAWWNAALYSPLPANSILAPEAYRIAASGTITSSAASQTLTPSANCGTAVGTGLGTGPAITLGSTITNALWFLLGDLTVRTAGTSGTIIAQFILKIGTTAGASTTITHAIYGNTTQTVDFTAAQGLTIGGTPSAAGVSVTPTQIHFMSWN